TTELIAQADLERAHAVVEFGTGTGRLAERLLRDHLPATARYFGIDISVTMVRLARERLAPWKDRTQVEQSDGSPRIAAASGTFDRFLSTYVLDLLSTEDIAAVVDEARRLLSSDGLLCLVSATHGRTPVERMVMGLATRLHSASPTLVGGCRAIDLRTFVKPDHWRVVHHSVVSKWGIASEVLVATPAPART